MADIELRDTFLNDDLVYRLLGEKLEKRIELLINVAVLLAEMLLQISGGLVERCQGLEIMNILERVFQNFEMLGVGLAFFDVLKGGANHVVEFLERLFNSRDLEARVDNLVDFSKLF